jgi:hypothetical protein
MFTRQHWNKYSWRSPHFKHRRKKSKKCHASNACAVAVANNLSDITGACVPSVRHSSNTAEKRAESLMLQAGVLLLLQIVKGVMKE